MASVSPHRGRSMLMFPAWIRSSPLRQGAVDFTISHIGGIEYARSGRYLCCTDRSLLLEKC